MNKNIYANSDEKFVCSSVFYTDESGVLYRDEEKTDLIGKEEATYLFKKNLILVDFNDGVYCRPVGIVPIEEGSYALLFFFPD